jgi:AmpD protein
MKVSAHFLIRRDGALLQFVPCGGRAWHAGESRWRGRARCNDFSIGIELEGTGEAPFTGLQYRQLARLTRALRARYPIRDIAGHSDIAPGRKSDPGPSFDWARYRALIGKRSGRWSPATDTGLTTIPLTARAPRRKAAPKKRRKSSQR